MKNRNVRFSLIYTNLAFLAVLCEGFHCGLIGVNISHDCLVLLEQRLWTHLQTDRESVCVQVEVVGCWV